MTYADRKAAWAAHNLHRHQASIWAAERARIFREEEIENLREAEEKRKQAEIKDKLQHPEHRKYLRECARRLYKEGSTMRQIAEKLGVPYSAARRWVVDLRVKPSLSPDVLRTKQLRDQGFTYQQISEMMECSVGVAWARYMRYLEYLEAKQRQTS